MAHQHSEHTIHEAQKGPQDVRRHSTFS